MVLVYGTICLDKVRRVASLPPKGSYVETLDDQVFLGGEAVNTALALTSWGVDVRLSGNNLGFDPDAELLVEMLSSRGLTLSGVTRVPAHTPACEIYVTPDGERTMFGLGFTRMASLTSAADAPFEADAWFTVDQNLGQTGRAAVRLASDAGMKIYLMDFFLHQDPVPPGCYWQSSTDWVGEKGNAEANLEWVRRFAHRYQCTTILTDAARGLYVAAPSLPAVAFPAFPCPSLVDTTGAGDVFRAGMLFGLSSGWPLGSCLRFASASGALKCQYFGASTRIPTVGEVDAHIGAHPETALRFET